MTDAGATGTRFLTAAGIKDGDFHPITKHQLRSQMRPCYSLKTRVWSFLMMQSLAYQSELVQSMKAGKRVALGSRDIAKALTSAAVKYYETADIRLDDAARLRLEISKTSIRRVLAELEEEGLCKRTTPEGVPLAHLPEEALNKLGTGNVRILAFFKPRAENPENVRVKYLEEVTEKNNEVDESGLPDIARLRLSRSILGKFGLRPIPELESIPSYHDAIAHAWYHAQQLFIKEVEGVASGLPRAVDPAGALQGAAAGVPDAIPPYYLDKQSDKPAAATDGRGTTAAAAEEWELVREALAAYGVTDEPTALRMLAACRKKLADCTVSEIIGAIHACAKDRVDSATRKPVGLLISIVPPGLAQYREHAVRKETPAPIAVCPGCQNTGLKGGIGWELVSELMATNTAACSCEHGDLVRSIRAAEGTQAIA